MHSRFSFKKHGKGTLNGGPSTLTVDSDDESKASTVITELQPPTLKYKRFDFYYSKWSKTWKYRNMSSKVTAEPRPNNTRGDDPWKEFCFVVVRTVPQSNGQYTRPPTFKVVIKSEYILKACKDVIQSWPGISWTANPLELDPEVFVTFLPSFIAYRDKLASKKVTTEENYVLASVDILLEWLHNDYRDTIDSIRSLTSHGEIRFDLLYALLVPRSIFVAECAVTGEPRGLKLISSARSTVDGLPVYQLTCESVDVTDRSTTSMTSFGRVQSTINLTYFKGTAKIASLNAFPIEYHPDKGLRQALIERGRKWLSLAGVHHKEYNGLAAVQYGDKIVKHAINSRIIIDRGTLKKRRPTYVFPTPVPGTIPDSVNRPVLDRHNLSCPSVDQLGQPIPLGAGIKQSSAFKETTPIVEVELSEEDLLLASCVLYGFSLADKMWMEFNVRLVENVRWNDDAFANLVIPSGRKALLQSLVESHHKQLGFDDFIKGKGQGLVINLFGPPGVGKTFSAEATSEHVRRPLYVVGAGDLGTKAIELDAALERVFDAATTWKAIVLIDEADVFLEQRSYQDLERNAMVAVFLRHLEYYRGIMFLTTNRIKAFDEAFLSRIHVALHFDELTQESKEQVWTAFLNKVGADITREHIRELAKRDVNGRQIKNAVRTAHSLAAGRGETVGFGHFAETLDAMDEFTTQFEAVRLKSAEST